MVSSDLSSYGLLSSSSRPSRSPLMNVPFEFSKSLMKIYRTQKNHEDLTHSKLPCQNQNGRTFPTLLPHLRTMPTQNHVTLMLRASRDEHFWF
jgi:hypothetical protein